MGWKRSCSLVLALAVMLTAVEWPGGVGRAAQARPVVLGSEEETRPGVGGSEEETRPVVRDSEEEAWPVVRATGAEAAEGQYSRDWEEMDGRGTPSEAEPEGISRFFARNPGANTGGKLEIDGEPVWYLNYIKDSPDKSYAYEVLDQSGYEVDQTWWNYWWDEGLGGWRIQAKPTQYSLDHEDYSYFILDDEGSLTTGIPAAIDGRPVVSMDSCFSAWPLPLCDPGVIPDTVVSADHCYENSDIAAMPELPEGLRSMDYMFAGCSELEETTLIPASVEYIDYGFCGAGIRETPEFSAGSRIARLRYTFKDCAWLERIGTLPDQVRSLEGTFWGALAVGADLRDTVIPDSVEEMEDTFFDSNLVEPPRLPAAVKTIDRCFMRCSGLVQVPLLPDSIESANQAFSQCGGLRFGDEDNVCVVAPRALARGDRMFASAYRTAGSADAYGRDSELLYLWNEEQWENIYRNAYGVEPGEASRDAYGDYNLTREPMGLSAMELLTTGPYIDSELVLEGGQRAMAVRFRGLLGRYQASPDYYPLDVIQYRTGGTGEFQNWDGNPVYLFEDTLVEARKIRTVETYDGEEELVTNVRAKMVCVEQPDVPVLSWKYMGGGVYDVTVMYRPFLRSLERVELRYRIDDENWKNVENFGHLQARCGQTVRACADWGAVSEEAVLRLPDYVTRIEVANPAKYVGLHERIPIVCRLFEDGAGDKTYQVKIIGDPNGIASVQEDENGNWSIGNSGYGQATVRVTARDGGGAAAEHTFSFVSPVQGISVALERHQDCLLNVGESDRALVSITPADREGHRLYVSDSSVLRLDSVQGTVTGLREGTAVLKAASLDDPSVTGQITIRVQGDPSWIVLEPASAELYSGETLYVRCSWGGQGTSAPEFVQEGTPVDWRIVEEREGSIRAEVTIRDEGAWGPTTFALRSRSDTGVGKSCAVTWKPYIRALKLSGPERMAAGGQARTEVAVDVESDEVLSYTSSDPGVLEVFSDGALTAKKAGEAVITVTASHGGAADSITVQVSEPEETDISDLKLILDRDVLTEGEICGYQVYVEPEYTSGTYSVTSSDPGVLEILDNRTVKAVGPGKAQVIVREDSDPSGGTPARDEREMTVVPNQSAVLEIYPLDELWERAGEPVIYKNLPGGQRVSFGCRIITAADDRSVCWSVDREDLAQIDGSGVLTPRKNGVVTVAAASNAYPGATAQYRVEIRTAATDIRYTAAKEAEGRYRLTASVWPADASPERVYCREPGAAGDFEDITDREYELGQIGTILEFSTCTDKPTIEDVGRIAEIRSAEEVQRRYELHSFHEEELYTVYTSDLDDNNGFALRIYDNEQGRYLESGESSGIHWPGTFSLYGDGQGVYPGLGAVVVLMELGGRLYLQVQSPFRLNAQSGPCTDIHFLSAGQRWEMESGVLSRREYRICSKREAPDEMSLRCLDRSGAERYRYDLSLYEGGVPEFRLDAAGQTPCTAVNSEQGEVFLDINGETFTSLAACAGRYGISVYSGQENVTDRMLKGVDGRGRPRVLLIDNGVYTITVANEDTGAVAARQVTAEKAGGFINMFLECPATAVESTERICAIRQLRGSRSIYAYGVPYSRHSGPLTGSGGVWYRNALRLDDDPAYELTYELEPDPDGGIRAEYTDHAITARGYTSDTVTVPLPENIKVTVKREGKTAAVLYGCYTVQGQLQGTALPARQYVMVEREYKIPLRFQSLSVYASGDIGREDIADGTVSLLLGGRPVTEVGTYGDFEITYLRDGELGLVCRNGEAGESELRAYVDGDRIFQRTGDPSYRGQRVGESVCHLYPQGKAHAEVENLVMDAGDIADLEIRCGLGNELSAGRVNTYKVLNAPEDGQPLQISGSRIKAVAAGEWLVQASVRFYNQTNYDVDCQFRVAVRQPARSLTIAERNGRTDCAVGGKLYLVPGYSPAEAGNVQGYDWEIKGNRPGAQVDQDGVVTADQAGEYTVVLRDLPERSLTAEFSFHVEAAQVKAEAIVVTPARAEAEDGEAVQFTARILPEAAGNREVVWEIEGADSRACFISRTGVFKGQRTGDYTVRCALAEDPEISQTAVVHVAARPQRLALSGPSCAAGDSPAQLRADVFPADAVYQGITWRLIAGEEQAQISPAGLVTCGGGIGRATVQATIDGTDISAVHEIALGRALPELRAEIRGADGAVKAEIRDAEDQAFLYINGNRATGAYIAENQCKLLTKPTADGLRIDSAGCVHGLLAGDYSVEVSREIEGFVIRDTVQISVSAADNYYFLEIWPVDGNYQIGEPGGEKQLKYRLVPELRSGDRIAWSISSGQDMGEISDEGLLRARGTGAGGVAVTCAVLDRETGEESISQNCTILISGQVAGVSGIHIDCAVEVAAGERIPVAVTVLPENAGNKAYRVEVSDPEIGEMRDGWFYAYSPGDVILTAVSEDNCECVDAVAVKVRQSEDKGNEDDESGRDEGDDGGRKPEEKHSDVLGGDQAEVLTFWRLRDGKWYYYRNDGTMAKACWVLYRNQWYRLGPDGVMFSNQWFSEDQKQYYLGNNGAMARSCWGNVDGQWHYFDHDGQPQPGILERDGFRLDGGELVYLGPEPGSWVEVGIYTYCLDERRRVRTGCWIERDGEWYYAGASGWILRNQWNEVNGNWCFLDPDGRMVRESTVWEGERYRMDRDGIARNTGL